MQAASQNLLIKQQERSRTREILGSITHKSANTTAQTSEKVI